MLIYRVEHTITHIGPYQFPIPPALKPMEVQHSDNLRLYPSKGMEFPDYWENPDWYACFDSVEILHIWFEGFHAALTSCDFRFATYVVPDLCVRHGKCQSLFHKPSSTLLAHQQLVNPF